VGAVAAAHGQEVARRGERLHDQGAKGKVKVVEGARADAEAAHGVRATEEAGPVDGLIGVREDPERLSHHPGREAYGKQQAPRGPERVRAYKEVA
jgi:hypothetical protein